MAERALRPLRLPPLAAITGAALVLVVAAGILAARLWPHQLAAASTAASRIEHSLGLAGWALAFGLQLVIALCGVLPASLGAITAGVAYGIVPAFLLSGTATLAGALIAFRLSRSLFKPVIERTLRRRPRLDRIDVAVAEEGWRLVCLLRLSPLMPFAVTSYALGLTSLTMRDYLLGTLASLPALLGYVVLGRLAGLGTVAASSGHAQRLHWALLALAVAATAVLTLRIGRLLRRALRLPEASAGRPAILRRASARQ